MAHALEPRYVFSYSFFFFGNFSLVFGFYSVYFIFFCWVGLGVGMKIAVWQNGARSIELNTRVGR